ncbi:peptide ABC transporter substrate-binding protein [Lactiplantibacillus dongliensis]|uniref:Peptide ABC transporter substrate-binding protein n=1 Tax=Lactiplantibacillus dongliensis TaxID=2559919 RepID=A0ABW1R560_9LACO|nr:peptide ABC transporter substrate-binding protein [Lactiplantibacillus dongliensis]
MKKQWLIGSALATTSFLLVACGNNTKTSNSNAQQKMNLSVVSEIATMDPSHASDTTSMQQLENTGEGFLQLGKDSKIENELATKIQESKDGKTYTFTLRHDGKWNDGAKLTARDFVYGWQRTINPKTASEYAYLYSGIQNADAIMNNKKNYQSLGIKAVGKYKVVVTLDHPISYFKLLMAMPVFYPQQKSAVDKFGKKYGTSSKYIASNGPFVLKGWNGTNNTWKLVKNQNYWDKKHVKLSSVGFQVVKSPTTSFNLYQTGKLDQTQLFDQQVANKKHASDFVLEKNASMLYLQMNMKAQNATLRKAYNNINIRKALSLALNRKQLVNKVLADGSLAPKGFVTEGLSKNPTTGEDFAKESTVKTSVSYNLTEARKYWKKGLAEIGVKKLSMNLLSDDTDTTKQVAEYVQGQWKKLDGMNVTLSNVPAKTRIDRSSKGNFQVVISGWGADFSDPVTFLNLYDKGNSGNAGNWNNATYDKLLTNINGIDSTNPTKRWQDMVKAEKVLMTEQVAIPLYQKSNAFLRSKKIKGLITNSAGPAHNYKFVSMSK